MVVQGLKSTHQLRRQLPHNFLRELPNPFKLRIQRPTREVLTTMEEIIGILFDEQ